MKLKLILVACLLNACSVASSNPDLDRTVQQHTAILEAISSYVNDLQVKGVLPKPVEQKE